MIAFTAMYEPILAVNYRASDPDTVAISKIKPNEVFTYYPTTKGSNLINFTGYLDRSMPAELYTTISITEDNGLDTYVRQLTPNPLKFTMLPNAELNRELLSEKVDTLASSMIKIEIASGNTLAVETVEATSSVVITEYETGGGNKGVMISDLNLELEVQRHKVFTFKFPKGFLAGLNKIPGVTAIGDSILQIEMKDYGQKILYVDAGEIIIKCVPGFRVTKA